MASRPFDYPRLLGTLQAHGVRFVVIGAVAAIAQGYPLATEDVDVTPDRATENLERLTLALRELNARLRLPDGRSVEFPVEPALLAQAELWTLTTDAAPLDLVFNPSGTEGFNDLVRDAIEVDLGTGTLVLISSLADVIRSKQAAGRPKDIAQLPALRQTLEVLRSKSA